MKSQPQKSKERLAVLGLIIGINGTGKTTFCSKFFRVLSQYRPVFFVHIGVEKAFNEYPEVSILNRSKIAHLKKGIYSVIAQDNSSFVQTTTDVMNGEPIKRIERKDVFFFVSQNIHNAIVVFDDVRNYLGDTIPQTLERLLIRRRQSMIDVFMTFHGLNLVPPKLFDYWTKIILFETGTSIERSKHKIPDIDAIEAAVKKVNLASKTKHKNSFTIINR